MEGGDGMSDNELPEPFVTPSVSLDTWEQILTEDPLSHYQCENCGSDIDSKAIDCCDECVLKFFFEDIEAPSLNRFRKEEVIRYLTGDGIWHGKSN